MNFLYRVSGTPLRAITVGVGLQIRFKDRLGYQLRGGLHPGPELSGRSLRTALDHKSHLGCVEIRHPFHPLRGQRFEVLKVRRIAGIDTLLVRNLDHASFSIAREWTDRADGSPCDALGWPPQRFDADLLFELVTLLEQPSGSEQKA
jgi:Family of unknown function (DUF5372)